MARTLATRWPRPLATAVAVSAGAQLAVTPLMLLHWSQLSLIGVVANLVVVPLAAALTTLGLLAVLIAAASDTVAHLVFQSLWLLLLGLRLVVRGFAAIPGAVIHVATPPAPALAAAAVALLTAPVATGRRGRLALTGLAAFAVVATIVAALPDGRLHVLMLDVGQGDAILVRGPDGRALLVDTGGGGPGRSDRGERVILPVLHRAGIRRLAALAITHGDPDHAGGLQSVLEGIPVDEVWVPAGTEGAEWQWPIAAAGVSRRELARGDRVWLGPLLVTALHPARPDPAVAGGPPWDENNGSLVLRVEWGLASALLTGDAEAKAERDMLAARAPLRGALLKVGHHGSRNASSPPFLAAVAPPLALVSVGARNPFGHPSPAALARLADAGAAIYRTDQDGAVEITSDATRLWIRPWARPALMEELLLRGAP
jgi:competence protein ComEC